jgi:alanyl-tRNA synthetase
MAEARDVKGIKLISRDLGSMGMDSARSLCDMIKDKYPSAVAVFAISDGDNFNFVSAAGKDAVAAGAHAGRLVGAVAAVTGGRGGGRPDSASAGGKEKEKTEEALRTAEAVLDGQIK